MLLLLCVYVGNKYTLAHLVWEMLPGSADGAKSEATPWEPMDEDNGIGAGEKWTHLNALEVAKRQDHFHATLFIPALLLPPDRPPTSWHPSTLLPTHLSETHS